MFDIIACANYMDVPSLVELGCAKVGATMKDKSVSQLRKMFNIENDYTPEEEKAIVEGRTSIWGEDQEQPGKSEE